MLLLLGRIEELMVGLDGADLRRFACIEEKRPLGQAFLCVCHCGGGFSIEELHALSCSFFFLKIF